MIQAIIAVPLLPLLGFLFLTFFRRRVSKAASGAIGSATVVLAFVATLFTFTGLQQQPFVDVVEVFNLRWPWVQAGAFHLNFGFFIDPLSLTMLLVITGVGSLIHIYSATYMHGEDSYDVARFFAHMNLFVFAMTVLVSANNFLLLLVGWGGVGLASFLLIGFYSTRPSAVAAAKKAFVVNVIGDFGLMVAMFAIVSRFGSLQYRDVLLASPAGIGSGWVTAIALLLFLAATAKSAQIPLYIWLPDAMEGPTPVSALIHAATMVTAGVYLVARAHPFYQVSHEASEVVAIIGGLTAFFAATIGIVQLDIKRVLAYSTISQLGYMFMAAGVGDYTASIFHLTTHAYFKALLFLGAGAVIHAMHERQDMRLMGGLRQALPYTFAFFLIGTLAISGIPPFSGFFSKDEILTALLARGHYGLWILATLTAGLTSFYMFRLFFMVFYGPYNGQIDPATLPDPATGETAAILAPEGETRPASVLVQSRIAQPTGASQRRRKQRRGSVATGQRISRVIEPGLAISKVHEVGPGMSIPLAVLAVLAFAGGFVNFPREVFGEFLTPVFKTGFSAATPSGLVSSSALQALRDSAPVYPVPPLYSGITSVLGLLLSLLGIICAYVLYKNRYPNPAEVTQRVKSIYRVLVHKYYVDEFYSAFLVKPLQVLGSRGGYLLEGKLFEGGVVTGLSRGVSGGAGLLRLIQTGYTRSYVLLFLGGTVLVIGYLIFARG